MCLWRSRRKQLLILFYKIKFYISKPDTLIQIVLVSWTTKLEVHIKYFCSILSYDDCPEAKRMESMCNWLSCKLNDYVFYKKKLFSPERKTDKLYKVLVDIFIKIVKVSLSLDRKLTVFFANDKIQLFKWILEFRKKLYLSPWALQLPNT